VIQQNRPESPLFSTEIRNRSQTTRRVLLWLVLLLLVLAPPLIAVLLFFPTAIENHDVHWRPVAGEQVAV
jgi:hypothetical protein